MTSPSPSCEMQTPHAPHNNEEARQVVHRQAELRRLYATTALGQIPRLLGAIDRHPFHQTYGCLDRQFWHYRTIDFASEMYQEGVLPLALVAQHDFPGSRWQGQERLRELVIAGLKFTAKNAHRDGSCDDYYPFERALGSAVFSLAACTEAYRILDLHEPDVLAFFERRAKWLLLNDEAGRLANHHALAALGLRRTAELTGGERFARGACHKVQQVLDWQHAEGWFEEYGGADPGYQTVTIDCLAKYRRLTSSAWLDTPLHRAVSFASHFMHPDDSYGGEYGSRGTYHFYPHGMELLAPTNSTAAALAEGFLRSLSSGTHAWFDDDRLFSHRLGNLLEAYLDWQPSSAASDNSEPETSSSVRLSSPSNSTFLPAAGLWIVDEGPRKTVVSAARGGVFKQVDERGTHTDAGWVLETDQGRVAVSHWHDTTRNIEFTQQTDRASLTVAGPLCWSRHETATPTKQLVFRLGLLLVGRFCRTLIRRLLQRRLITGRRSAPIRFQRRFEWTPATAPGEVGQWKVIDELELLDPRLTVRRLCWGVDHESAYVAASRVYQASVLQPWTDHAEQLESLNHTRRLRLVRSL